MGLFLQALAVAGTLLQLPQKEYLLWGGGMGSFLIGLDFQRFTGGLQYVAAFVGNLLLATALIPVWKGSTYPALGLMISLLLFAVALTVRQKFMHVFTYTRLLWVEPLLLLVGIGLLILIGKATGIWPWPAFLAAIPGLVISAGYIQDAPYIAEGAAQGYAVKVGDEAPDFELPSTRGNLVRLSQFFPKNPVLLLFVRGDWCPGCHMMLRTYERHKERFYAKHVVILGIGPDPLGVNQAMIERLGVSFQMLSDETFSVIRRYGNSYKNEFLQKTMAGYEAGVPLPAAYLIDKKGIVRYISSSEYVGEFLDPTTIFPVLEKIEPGEPLTSVNLRTA
ncbi:MAG: peroxiredoxin family protein [Bacteroidia bacterium]|nr:peroxiredoxin family protein [Bacteroidia bacterium]